MKKYFSKIRRIIFFMVATSILLVNPMSSSKADDEYITYDDAGDSMDDNGGDLGGPRPRKKCYKYVTFGCQISTTSTTSASGSISVTPTGGGVSGSYSTTSTSTEVNRRMCQSGTTESVCINENCAGVQVTLLCPYI